MNLQSRLGSLQTRHAGLDDLIAAEHQRPQPDPTSLGKLKREKLRLKEEIERLKTGGAAS